MGSVNFSLPESHFKANPVISRDLTHDLYLPGAGNKTMARKGVKALSRRTCSRRKAPSVAVL